MNFFTLVLIVLAGLFVFIAVRNETKRLRNKIRKFFKGIGGGRKTYVSTYKKTVTVPGHYRNRRKGKKKR
ncbi:hypothetical protein IQ265_19925 [Nodosilinea sp. LEGE 06152]|jgi:hypothetical protein|uniref:hypothetical protein n=1 Tax=Nodosilinea sp. LEGE 06152 TaxID=2777966 RepID=UPI00187F3144|nr:hypothetical protein [Nodosilinea sp. LEGE 06152]MBE9159085.1 hypothetical protein [Nodosilinea sp. LEGE 06152]